jgi:hypothetical protein
VSNNRPESVQFLDKNIDAIKPLEAKCGASSTMENIYERSNN